MSAAELDLGIEALGIPALLPTLHLAAPDALDRPPVEADLAASPIDVETARRIRSWLDDSRAEVPTVPRTWERVPVGNAQVDCLSYDEAVDAVCELAAMRGRRDFVVTPNIQHIALLRRDREFAEAYADAALVLPDGAPVVLTLRALTGRQQSRVTGADLLPAVCRAAAAKGLTVGILGGRPGAAEDAAWRMTTEFPGLEIVLVEEAPVGFDSSPEALETVLDHVEARNPDVLFVGLGAPKQEKFVHRHRNRLGSGVVLCVGAAIDFTAGYAVRAPKSWQRWGCEWLWRVVHEPRRLAGRYAKAAPLYVLSVLPALLAMLLSRTSGRGR